MKRINERLDKLEGEVKSQQHRVSRIEIVCAETGEVGAVIHVGGQPDQEGVMQALKYKHETDPPRKVRSRSAEELHKMIFPKSSHELRKLL